MPVDPGTVSISMPAPGDVLVGLLRVAGGATAGQFTKPDRTYQAELPPSTVTVRLDGGTPQVATQRGPDWRQWDTLVSVTAPGPHKIVATARRGVNTWTATDTVNVNAVASRMRIGGVEQTQSIQFFDYEFQGSAAGPDNSVPLIDQKATMLRAYVAYTKKPPGSIDVSGELKVGSDSLFPSNGPIDLRDDDDIDRGQFDHTLNFLLPPNICVGAKTCTLRVFDPKRPGARLYEDEDNFTLTFVPTPRLRIFGVLIHYTRPGFNVAAPSSTAFTVSLDTTARIGPIRQINYTGFIVIPFDGDLTVPPSGTTGCGPGWDALLTKLREMRTASGTTVLYVALLPAGVPLGGPGAAIGCGSIGVAAGPQNDAFTMMHEVGHALGRMHAPCPANVANSDASYPTFTNPHTNRPPYPKGTIGEYGFNLAINTIRSPQDTRDVMSSGGCQPFWISPHTFVGMRNAIVGSQPLDLVSASAADDVPFGLVNASAADDDTDEYLHLIVRLRQDGDVEFVSAFHLPGPSPVSDPGPISSVTCELIGASGEVIESGRLYEELLQRPGGPYTQYFGTLRWDPSVQAIALTRDGDELHRRRVEETAPPVRLSTPELREENGEQMYVEWTGDASHDVPLTYIPRYSNDDGKTWQALGPAQAATWYELDLNALPGGERCRFQIAASSGIRTSIITSDPFTVPLKPTTAQILSPVDGTEIREGEHLLMHGRAFSPDFGTTPSEEMLWFSDLDGLVAAGHETWATNLSEGRHQLTLRVPDGLGEESEDAVTIQVAAAT